MREKLLETAKQILKVNSIDLYKNRHDISEWDSLAHIQLVASIEEEFNLSIPFEEVANINCLADFLKYLEE